MLPKTATAEPAVTPTSAIPNQPVIPSGAVLGAARDLGQSKSLIRAVVPDRFRLSPSPPRGLSIAGSSIRPCDLLRARPPFDLLLLRDRLGGPGEHFIMDKSINVVFRRETRNELPVGRCSRVRSGTIARRMRHTRPRFLGVPRDDCVAGHSYRGGLERSRSPRL